MAASHRPSVYFSPELRLRPIQMFQILGIPNIRRSITWKLRSSTIEKGGYSLPVIRHFHGFIGAPDIRRIERLEQVECPPRIVLVVPVRDR
jgi:hypothetical protein